MTSAIRSWKQEMRRAKLLIMTRILSGEELAEPGMARKEVRIGARMPPGIV
jgi:hypothetical protein